MDVSSGCLARRRRLQTASSDELTIHYDIHTDTSAAVNIAVAMGELSPATFDPALDAVVPADLTSVFESVTTTAVGDPTLASGTFAPTTSSPTQMPAAVRRSNITVPLNYTFDGVDGRCASFVKAVSTAALIDLHTDPRHLHQRCFPRSTTAAASMNMHCDLADRARSVRATTRQMVPAASASARTFRCNTRRSGGGTRSSGRSSSVLFWSRCR